MVIEHDAVDGLDNSSMGVPSAKWFAVDYFVFNEPPGTEPPPYNQGGGSGPPQSPITFEDIAATQTQLIDYANVNWDHPDIFGYGIYDAASSVPYDGNNYILNLHGKRLLGFSFNEPTFFNGAFFTKCSRRWDIDRDLPEANSADSIMLHYYDENDQLIGSSPWIVLDRDPEWYAAEMTVSRVVIEHDGMNPYDNSSKGEPLAQWYSIDHMVFNEPAGYEPPPYGGGGANPPESPVTFDNIAATQQSLTSYANIEWDRVGDFGFGVYDAESSDPYDGTNYILNRHGARTLGFTLQVPSFLNGAFFARCSIRETVDRSLPEAYSADSLRLHYYDENDQLIGVSDWFTLQYDPTWYAIEQTVSRVVIEHDGVNGYDNTSYGEPNAKWYAVDHIVFDEPAGFEPPPYCVDEDNDGICDDASLTGPPQSPIEFDDAPPVGHAMYTYGNVDWDREGPEFGWGWGVYNTSNSIPSSGSNYVMNLHGKNFLGFSLGEPTLFEGAYFAKASIQNWLDVDDSRSHAADSIRLHYFDASDNLIGTTPWIYLTKQPQWFAANQVASRIVIEHDTVNAFPNDAHGEPLAKWYSIDHMVFGAAASASGNTGGNAVLLTQNYPNPFNPTTVIRFTLPQADRVELTVYNVLGQRVRVLVDGSVAAGEHEVVWNADNDGGQKVSAGVYFYRLVTSEATVSRKMLLVK
jgi:hypothetical protein